MQTVFSAEPFMVTAAPAAAPGGLSTMKITPSFSSFVPIGTGHSVFGATTTNQLDLPSFKASAASLL